MTQNIAIKQHLNEHGSITAIEALRLYGCFRLAARIKNLRDAGMDILTHRISRRGKTFALYQLCK